METIYITGHKNPDLDSVMGALAYAYLKSNVDTERSYVPVVPGSINAETKYILEKYTLETPTVKESVAGEKVILVDHNEKEQAIDDMHDATILEVIDHHKMQFSYSDPIRIIIEPIGSSCSVIAKMFKADGVTIPENLAAGMLAAVLTDTVITKSPTTTDEDLKIIEELAQLAGIDDWKAYGMEIFKVRSSVSDLTDAEIITADYKDFDIHGNKIGIGQVETVDIGEFENRRESLLKALADKKEAGAYHSVILFLTDILKEESHFLIASDEPDTVAQAFSTEQRDNMFTAPVLSRKKEVVPNLTKILEK